MNLLVREAIDNASRLNLSLRKRWGMYEKRKFSEGSGPQPKNKRQKRDSFRGRKQHHSLFQMVLPVQSTPPQAQGSGGQQQQYVFVPSCQSPAFNPFFENQQMSFRAAGFVPHRGGRGRGGRGRGQYQRGRGNQCRGTPRGGSSRGQGARGAHSQ